MSKDVLLLLPPAVIGEALKSKEYQRALSYWQARVRAFAMERGVDIGQVNVNGCYSSIVAAHSEDEVPIRLPEELHRFISSIYGDDAFVDKVRIHSNYAVRGERETQDDAFFTINLSNIPFPVIDAFKGEKRIVRKLPDNSEIAIGNTVFFHFTKGRATLLLSTTNYPFIRGDMKVDQAITHDIPITPGMIRAFTSFVGLLDRRDTTRLSVYKPFRGLEYISY